MHIPAGFGVVTPYLFVDGAAAYVRFLTAAFDAREVGRSTAADGRIGNCQLCFDTMIVMVSEASADWPATRASHYLYVADSDAAIARAERAGAERVMDVADMPYGDRQGGVRDPAGNLWWISQRLTPEPYFPEPLPPA